MKSFACVFIFLQVYYVVLAEIRSDGVVQRLKNLVQVGGKQHDLLALTEMPPPHNPKLTVIHRGKDGRRHLEEECTSARTWREEEGGVKVDIVDEYYDDRWAKTVATVVYPSHIDRKHFEVTTQEPYLTVGTIDGIGYHPSTVKSEHPGECEKIYQEFMADQYSEESAEQSEESMEVARVPLAPEAQTEVPEEPEYRDPNLY